LEVAEHCRGSTTRQIVVVSSASQTVFADPGRSEQRNGCSPHPSARVMYVPRVLRTLTLLVAISVVPAFARGDDSNFRPYVIGGRAAGMGGAFTALSDDGSGPYFNPGGIAFARRSSLSLTASVYGIVRGTLANALGDGHDFKYSDLNTFPVSTSVVRKFGSRDTPDGSPDSSIALSVIVPDAFRIDDRDAIMSQQNAFFLASELQTVWAGLTYARRFGRLGVGASAFGLLGTQTDFVDITAAPASDRFVTLTQRTDISTHGVVGAFGIRYDATDRLRLGLSVFSPELGTGTRRVFARSTVSLPSSGMPPQIQVVTADDLHAEPTLPLRVQSGIAWATPTWTISADAIYLGSRSVHVDADRAMESLDRRTVRNAVIDGALGAELVIAGAIPIRAGVFTDFSASNEPQATVPGQPDPNASNTDHINRYGSTLSIGYRTEHTSTDAGMIVSSGSGHDLVPKNLDFSMLVPSTSSQLYTYVFISSSYEF
jgi:hypothetical protein